jgi:methylated-DNA-[protein]-cysteine S-methyltransferase
VTRNRRLIDSPLGPILLSADCSGRLTGAHFGDAPDEATPGHDGAAHSGGGVLDDATAQLAEYFEGRRRCFELPLKMQGSAFQQRVWTQLQKIPFGTTVSYRQLAAQLGQPGAARAVGHANSLNPIAIIVPCHRVIGSLGQLTGYGGGLGAKHHLLDLEARGAPSPRAVWAGGDR